MIISNKKVLAVFAAYALFISGTSNADIFAISPNDSSSEIQIFNLDNEVIEQVDSYYFDESVIDFDFNSQTGDLFALTTTGLWKRDTNGNTDLITDYSFYIDNYPFYQEYQYSVDEDSLADIAISPSGLIAVSPNDSSFYVFVYDSDGNESAFIDFSVLNGCNPFNCPEPAVVGGISYDPSSGDLYGATGAILYKSSTSGEVSFLNVGKPAGGEVSDDVDITISTNGLIAHTITLPNNTNYARKDTLTGNLVERIFFNETIEELAYNISSNDLYALTTDGIWRNFPQGGVQFVTPYNVQESSGADIAFLITDLHWTGNGEPDNWLDPNNWSAKFVPNLLHSVFIDSEYGDVVFGPWTNMTFKSLTIGSHTGDTNELKMLGGGEITATDGVFILPNGILNGLDTIHADISNSGIVSPGDYSPGLLEVDGNFTQSNDGELIIEIAGLEAATYFDVLQVNGTATLVGTLTIDLLGFTPSLGDTFDIFSAETLNGSFNSVAFPVLDEGMFFDVTYLFDETGSTDIIRLSVVSFPPSVWIQVTGTAQGGLVFFTVAGVTLSVSTTNGLTPEQVIQAMVDAVNNDATLSSMGVTALAVGDTIYINNQLTGVETTDPGFILSYGFGKSPVDGDINLDGTVNVVDILLGQQVLNDTATLSPEQFIHGDVAPLVEGQPDPDGEFTLGDLLIIERKALGVISF